MINLYLVYMMTANRNIITPIPPPIRNRGYVNSWSSVLSVLRAITVIPQTTNIIIGIIRSSILSSPNLLNPNIKDLKNNDIHF